MPGNVKLGKSNEPDPDPTPYLYVSADIKRMDSHKPYDPKKSVWIPDENGGFSEGNFCLHNLFAVFRNTPIICFIDCCKIC